MDAQCDEQQTTVVGGTKLTVYLQRSRRSTDNLGQFITLHVHLCVQHGAREAARRVDPSAAADTSHFLASIGINSIRNMSCSRVSIFKGLALLS